MHDSPSGPSPFLILSDDDNDRAETDEVLEGVFSASSASFSSLSLAFL